MIRILVQRLNEENHIISQTNRLFPSLLCQTSRDIIRIMFNSKWTVVIIASKSGIISSLFLPPPPPLFKTKPLDDPDMLRYYFGILTSLHWECLRFQLNIFRIFIYQFYLRYNINVLKRFEGFESMLFSCTNTWIKKWLGCQAGRKRSAGVPPR